MNPLDYLAFRRKVVFLDEWLSYLFLVWIYYYFEERNYYILILILSSIGTFNLIGYIYLGFLERHFDIYGFRHQDTKPIFCREPLTGLLTTSK